MINKAEKTHLHKADVMCRIFKVKGWLDPKGFDKRIHEIEVESMVGVLTSQLAKAKTDGLVG